MMSVLQHMSAVTPSPFKNNNKKTAWSQQKEMQERFVQILMWNLSSVIPGTNTHTRACPHTHQHIWRMRWLHVCHDLSIPKQRQFSRNTCQMSNQNKNKQMLILPSFSVSHLCNFFPPCVHLRNYFFFSSKTSSLIPKLDFVPIHFMEEELPRATLLCRKLVATPKDKFGPWTHRARAEMV